MSHICPESLVGHALSHDYLLVLLVLPAYMSVSRLLSLSLAYSLLPLLPPLPLSTFWSTKVSACTRMICSTGSSQCSSKGIR